MFTQFQFSRRLCRAALFVLVFVSFQLPAQEAHPAISAVPGYALPEENAGAQSPINILTGALRHTHHDIALHYQPSREHIVNRGHTIEADFDEGSTLVYDGEEYELRQLHFHTPAEHLIDGITYPMELHMVHTLRGREDKYLVVGVLFREGQDNAFIEEVLAHAPARAGERFDGPLLLDAHDALGEIDGYYHYEGSLTTPPYSETVTWLVLKDIRQAAPGQIESLNRLEGDNARHIQALNSRLVEEE